MSSASEYLNTTSNSPKRSAALKLRPSVLNSPPHVMMPSNLNLPWSPCDMSWAVQSTSGGVVEFRGQPSNSLLCKRKAEEDQTYVKPKQLITEETMAEHLNGLHISTDFTSHNTAILEDYNSDTVSMESDSSSSSPTEYQFSKTPKQDLEQKLRNAQRITICEEIRKLKNEPAIPHAILSRFERPSSALVLWQPPPKIIDLCTSLSQQYGRKMNDEEQDNNNSSSIDFNNSMDLDM